jgi:hypothetical protein
LLSPLSSDIKISPTGKNQCGESHRTSLFFGVPWVLAIKVQQPAKERHPMTNFRPFHALAIAAAFAAAIVTVQAQQSDLVLFGGASNPGGVAGYIIANETNASEFYPAFLPTAANVPQNIGITLYEDATQTVASDQLWTQAGYWYFASDPNLINFAQNGITQVGALVENGAVQDVSSYFGLPGPVGGATYGIAIQSDVEVPEPAAGLLLSLGGGLLLLLHRQRTKRA